jgi:predicted nucleotidyltransferase
MNNQIQSELDTIVAEITSLVPDAQVILFGSYAKGQEHEDSDLDLCIVSESFPGRRIDLMHAIRYAVYKKTSLPLDIVVYPRKEFQINSKSRSRMEHSIVSEGVVLHA